MHSHAARDRLVYPVAVLLTLGLVSVPHSPGSAATGPRLTEFAAVQLQAEVTALVSGIADAAESIAPGAAASTGIGAGAAATSCTYPCTIFDKLLDSLPEDIRYALLPALYSVAWVIGLVMAPVLLVTSALFGWPVSLKPAAAADSETGFAPEILPAPAQVTAATGDRPSTPVDDAGNDAAAVKTPTTDLGTEIRVNRHTRVGTTPVAGPEVSPSPTAVAVAAGTASPEVTAGPAELPATPEVPAEAAEVSATPEVPATPEVTATTEVTAEAAEVPSASADEQAPPADLPVEPTTTTDEPTPVADRAAATRTGSAGADNSDSAPERARAATRSVR